MPSLETHELRAGYGKVAILHGLTFKTMTEGITAILGANGAGKTTTLRTVMGLTKVYGGLIKVDGIDVTGWPTHKLVKEAGLAIVPEGRQLFAELSVRENLVMGAFASGISNAEMRKRIDYVLQRCWLKDVRRQLVGTLSKGYRQRVGLADALLADPPVLILDEPTAGLDPTQIRETRKLIRELGQEHTMLLSTHILSEVEMACDSAIIIYQGAVVANGTLADLRQRHGNRSLEEVFIHLTGQEGI